MVDAALDKVLTAHNYAHHPTTDAFANASTNDAPAESAKGVATDHADGFELLIDEALGFAWAPAENKKSDSL